MCGGINLSQCIPVADDDNGKTPKNKIIFASLLYNTGRVISYSVIGFLLDYIIKKVPNQISTKAD